MSVNGVLSTREIETQYNTIVYNLLYLLQYRVRKLYSKQSINELNFQSALLKAYNKSVQIEKTIVGPPKFSEALKDLAQLIIGLSKVSDTKP